MDKKTERNQRFLKAVGIIPTDKILTMKRVYDETIEDLTRLNLYLWLNEGSDSDFADKCNCIMPHGSNAHSGGVVVLAESQKEAIELIKKHTRGVDIRKSKGKEWAYDYKHLDTSPVIIPLTEKGVVLFCDGDC